MCLQVINPLLLLLVSETVRCVFAGDKSVSVAAGQ